MDTLTTLLDKDAFRREPLTLDADTRLFLNDLLLGLGNTLRPGRPPGVEARARFLDAHLLVDPTQQTVVGRRYPRPLSNQVLVRLEDMLHAAPYRTGHAVDYDDDEGQRAPYYRSVPVSLSEARAPLEEGYYPSYRGETPFVVGVAQREKLNVWFHLRAEDRALSQTLFDDIEGGSPLYRGQAIRLNQEGFPTLLRVPETRLRQDVILDPGLQDELERQVLHFLEREQAYRTARLPFRRGLILAGPPGVGKTQVFRALTHQLAGRCTVLWVTSGSISHECSVADVFALARSLQPTLLLWEDLDLSVPDRSLGRPNRELGELLAQLDGPESAEGIITCASTNDVSGLDQALRSRPSRFDRVLHLGPPRRDARIRLLQRFAAGIQHLAADLELLADRTDGLTGAQLKELVVAAFTCALDEAGGDPQAASPTVTTAHFMAAIEHLNLRPEGPERWRTVLGAATRYAPENLVSTPTDPN